VFSFLLPPFAKRRNFAKWISKGRVSAVGKGFMKAIPHQNCPISKRAIFAKWFHFSERTPPVRDWHSQSLFSACRFGKEEISYGGLLRYGIYILLSLAIANLLPYVSIP